MIEYVFMYRYTFAYSGDSTQLTYLRSRYYSSGTGRFLTRDTWGGDYNRPLSLNRWMYVEGNPVNHTDPSGHFPEGLLSQAIPAYLNSVSNIQILTLIYCSPVSGSVFGNSNTQYDLTGYLAVAMTKHGQDTRVKLIAATLGLADIYRPVNDLAGTAIWASAYLAFNELEGGGKVWDIKLEIKEKLGDGIYLCGKGANCRWVDYSTPGNIHFGYVAGLAKIDKFVAAIAGGLLEQKDLIENNLPLEPLYCFQNSFPGLCDNPADQAAVDFGYKLAVKYGRGINDQQLRQELHMNGLGSFQGPPPSFAIPHSAIPMHNFYGADYFNQ